MTRKRYSRPTKEVVDKNELEQKKRQALERSDLREVLETAGGRRFVWRLIEFCKVFHSIWDNSSRIHYLEGQRNVGLMLLNALEDVDPEMVYKIAMENRKETTNE